MQLAVIVPAAGSSSRFNDDADPLMGPRSKLDEDLGGRTVLQRAVELFTKHPLARWIVVAGPHDPAAHDQFMLRHGGALGLLGATVCRGGVAHRYETIANALEHVPAEATHIAVHDAARPCCPPELIDRLLDAAQQHAAVIPGVSVADTLKRLGARVQDEAADPIGDLLGAPAAKPTPCTVVETVDRSELIAVQTPQVFEADLLRRAYAQSDLTSTDDAQLVERLGEPVVVIPGDARNLKITTPTDLPLARAVLGISGGQGKAEHKRF